jgi:two-component system sensor histidine kinase AlgZ
VAPPDLFDLPSTWRALLAPRRLLPVAVVALGLIGTELWATRHLATAATLALFVVLFVAFVPAAWRWLHRRRDFLRGSAYVALGLALVLGASLGPVALFGQEPYVAHPPAMAALLTLVLIAGWVLGRDIELSADLDRAEERGEALGRAAEDARLLAIRHHLDPHFLFNTLGAIAEWCRDDPEVAERALLELSRMLRTLFEGIRAPLWPLRREVDLLLALHGLYALRDDDRYRLESHLPELPAVELPPLLLLPLFENALTHGTTGAPMRLSIEAGDRSVTIRIWNAGAFAGRRTEGTGIATTEQRLALAYEAGASMRVGAVEREGVAGTEAVLTLPREPEAQLHVAAAVS